MFLAGQSAFWLILPPSREHSASLAFLLDDLPIHLSKLSFAPLALGGAFSTVGIGTDDTLTPRWMLNLHPLRLLPTPLL